MLIYAHRAEADQHDLCRRWLEGVLASDQAYGVNDLVLSGFIRIVTNPAVFKTPTRVDAALHFCDVIRGQSHAVAVAPGPRHWDIFTKLCRASVTKGNLVADAYLAALAIESGCEWITTDGDFARFPGLKWRRPT